MNELTPALALVPGAEELLPLLERLAELEKRNGGLLPENVRKVIDAVAPFVEKRRQSVLDCGAPLSDLQAEDFETYRKMMIATLTPEEREAADKFAAVSAPSSTAPAAKNRHHEQLRDEGGRWRTSMFRRGDTKPNLPGLSFFR